MSLSCCQSFRIMEAQRIPLREIKAPSSSINRRSRLSDAVSKSLSIYTIIGRWLAHRFNNSSQGRVARRPPAFHVLSGARIHKFINTICNTRAPKKTKTLFSNASPRSRSRLAYDHAMLSALSSSVACCFLRAPQPSALSSAVCFCS